MFQETVQLLKAIQYSFTSSDLSSQNTWENILLGITYVLILAILPFAILTDLFSFLPAEQPLRR